MLSNQTGLLTKGSTFNYTLLYPGVDETRANFVIHNQEIPSVRYRLPRFTERV